MVKETINSKEPSIKKRRKNSGGAGDVVKQEEDVYKKIVEFEESEASSRSSDKDVELFFQTCQNIRSNLAEIAKLKKSDKAEVLKKLNRLEKFRTKGGRDSLHQEKIRTDSTKLQLQNLLYELTYLKKEISKCFQFKSMDEEIDLVPIEQFYKEAPSSIAKPEVLEKNPHQLNLARLEWELQQRKELSSQCQKFESEKQKVANEIISKQDRLDKLAPQLSNILDIIKPLQEHLGLPNEMIRQDHHLAHLLPNPLYLLYAKVDAYCQVYDKNTTMNILGEEEEAKQLKENNKLQNFSDNSDSDAEDMTEENSNDRKKRHHRKSSKAQKEQEKRDKLIASHPLYIQIKKNLDKTNKYTLILNFYYKTKLHVVIVKCQVLRPGNETLGVASGEVLSPENLLRELFPNDLGEESPNPTNHYQLRQLELGNFSSLLNVLGYPYLWVQRICGLDFIPSQRKPTIHLVRSMLDQSFDPLLICSNLFQGSKYALVSEITSKSVAKTQNSIKVLSLNGEQVKANSELSQSSVESVMQALTSRFCSRIALSSQMNELEKNLIPSHREDQNTPLKLNGAISQWQRITWQKYSQNPSTSKLVAENFVVPTDMHYRFNVTRGTAKLIAYVAIKNNFPEEKTIFSINVIWNGNFHSGNSDALRDIERAVNVEWTPDDKKGFSSYLLSAQIRRLVACFDVYLEITSPDVFPKDKIYFSSTRGRNRERPYKYLKLGGGIFTQY